MPTSRYKDTPIVSGSYQTWSLPVQSMGLVSRDLTQQVKTLDYVWQKGDRMDTVAARYLGDDRYGWVILLVNNISYPFGIVPGTVLKLPMDVRDVLDFILR